jgi:uncharacterized protein YcbX
MDRAQPRAVVAALSVTPVKSLRIARPQEILIEAGGARGDRAFFLVDERGRMVNGKHYGALQQVSAELSADGLLTLHLPGGEVRGEVRLGEELDASFYSGRRAVRALDGPFSGALSEHVGSPLRVVADAGGASAVDRGADGAVTVVCSASVAALAAFAGSEAVDSRRFRMTIEVEGTKPFEEDGWLGREIRVGGATIRPLGHVGRCIVTSRDPDSGEVDLPTLDLLREMRGDADTTEPLALGVFGEVVAPGTVRVGDAVELTAAGTRLGG